MSWRAAVLTLALLGACGGDDDDVLLPDAMSMVDAASGGRFRARWSVRQGGASATCADVGAETVSVLATDAQEAQVDSVFPCVDREGVTMPLPLGAYGVVVRLLDASERVVSESPALEGTLTLDGEIVDLPTVAFHF